MGRGEAVDIEKDVLGKTVLSHEAELKAGL